MKKAIKSRRLRAGAVTYTDLFKQPQALENDAELLNHQRTVGLLVDPDSYESFNTHSLTASSRKHKKLLADLFNDEEPEIVGEELDVEEEHLDDLTEEEVKANEEAADNASEIVENISPIEASEDAETPVEEEVEVVEEKTEEPEVEAEADESVLNLEEDTELENSEEEAVEAGTGEEAEQPFVNPPSEQAGKQDSSTVELVRPEAPQTELAVSDALEIVDLDAMDDAETDDVDFVAIDEDVLAIKAGRVIAKLTRAEAARKNILAAYMQDHFERAVRVEMQKTGLRAGLKNCGFVLATVKVPASKQIALKIAAAKKSIEAAAIKSAADAKEIRLQATAIACEALNRGQFKGYKNELRAALVAHLEQAGVRGAKAIVAQVFAEKGIEYLQSILALAEKIEAMPEEVRDGYAEQLDLTEEDFADDECEACDDPIMAAVAKPIRELTASAEHNDVLAALKSGSDSAFFKTF